MTRGSKLAALLVLALLVPACGSDSARKTEPPSKPTTDSAAVVEVPAAAETQQTQHSGDSADDPALWVNSKDGAASLVIGNDKQGALETYNLDGSLVQRIEAPTAFWGNVDVRTGARLPSGPTDVVAAANSGVRLYSVDTDTRKLTPITPGGAALDTGGGEGLCLYDSPDGGLSVFMVFISGGVRQFALHANSSGDLFLELVRSFKVGSEAEGCVVDDENHALYIAEENVGLWKYDADPAGGERRTMIDELSPHGHQISDIEGVTMADDGAGTGLIFSSSQGQWDESSYFSIFDRETGKYRSSFRIVDGENADGCSHTDGIAATAQPLGPAYPQGVFVCQDDDNTEPGGAGNQNFKLTRLERVRP